jgi:ribonucleoside-diphosphate reductase beta chain
VSDTTAPRTERIDFQATSDPALHASADRGETRLLDYGQLYALWERQHWATQDLDFTQDRTDWHERIDAEERYARMYGLSSFFAGEQRVAAELGPMMRAVPGEDMRLFLCTQIADEARHVAFFDRFYAEVGVLESDNLQDRLAETSVHLNAQFGVLFDEMLHSRVDRLAVEPEDEETLVEAVTIYHMVVEGMLALTGQHFILDYNERQNVLPGFNEASSTSRATSIATSPSARASCGTCRGAIPATSRRSSAPWSKSGPSPTACCGRRGSSPTMRSSWVRPSRRRAASP